MRLPQTPPPLEEILPKIGGERLLALGLFGSRLESGERYWHWDELIRRTPPQGWSHEEWWLSLKLARRMASAEVPLKDRDGLPFRYVYHESLARDLHELDLRAGGRIEMPQGVTNADTRDQYYVTSLMEEAITSSQLEGAATTREVAKEMLRESRPPQDRGERMILNNYLTMRRISAESRHPLTVERILALHRTITESTLADPGAAGRVRLPHEQVVVADEEGRVLHKPPRAEDLPSRLSALCDFANGATPRGFLHPILRAFILHFWLAYDHPFLDGNGRTARALFYWCMLKHDYWLCEFLSISRVLLKAPVQYYRAFQFTETDENDLTYFLLHQMSVLKRAIGDLHEFIARKARAQEEIEEQLIGLRSFNHRQRALLIYALQHPGQVFTVDGHRRSHNIVNETARTDLMDLAERGLLVAEKQGRKWTFRRVPGLEERLRALTAPKPDAQNSQ